MNTAVHTSTSVHRCRDDMPGTSAIGLTTPAVVAVMKAAVSSALYCQEWLPAGGDHADPAVPAQVMDSATAPDRARPRAS